MTDEQKFFLDLKGWITLPAVLDDSEIEEMKAAVYGGAKQSYEAPLDRLLDHPAIVGILSEILRPIICCIRIVTLCIGIIIVC